jgi:hypothetical protein
MAPSRRPTHSDREVHTYIERGELLVEYRGKRYRPPFRQQLVVRAEGGASGGARAVVYDRDGKEVELFRSTLESAILEHEESEVVQQAESLTERLNDAVEKGNAALAARDAVRKQAEPKKKSAPVQEKPKGPSAAELDPPARPTPPARQQNRSPQPATMIPSRSWSSHSWR